MYTSWIVNYGSGAEKTALEHILKCVLDTHVLLLNQQL